MEPALVQFERESTGKLRVIRINTDHPETDQYKRYGSYYREDGDPPYHPQTVILKNGKVARRQVGKMSLDDMRLLYKSIK
jgi:hypothetical protein